MTDIFFSYSREDKDRVAFIAAALEAEGYDLWWDTDIAPGETYRGVTQAKLRAAKCVIVVWSETSVHSRWVIGEAEEGLERDILLPIIIDDVVRDIPLDFRSVQVANLTRWKGDLNNHEWKKVLASVKRLVEEPAKPPQRYRKPKRPGGGGRGMAALAVFFGVIAAGIGFLYWSSINGEGTTSTVAREEPTASTDRPTDRPQAAASSASGPRVRERFRDCADCPEMIVVPAGSFRMGDLNGGGDPDEKPVHTVTIAKPFAVGVYEVTWAEWEACVAEGGCSNAGPNSAGGDEDWERGRRPVINVSWQDAQAYVGWLSRKTGATYRLLSEAEWEYVARAGTTTKYSWGNGISHSNANYGTDECCKGFASGRDQWVNTAPVGSFDANAFGLYDVHGNVWEWVQDCWNDSYSGAPSTGWPAWEAGDCSRRVVRGGSWDGYPGVLRSANRGRIIQEDRGNGLGFRVAKDP